MAIKIQDIKEHMEVLGADGKHVGTVDCTKGDDKIVLTKGDPQSGGQHHLIPVTWCRASTQRSISTSRRGR